MKALDLSYYFIERAGEIDENDLTNLKLQKLLYFAQGEYLAREHKLLFEDQIEAWDLGPVIKDVYNQYKLCGSFPITVFDTHTKRVLINKKVKEFLDIIWTRYGKFSAAHLVEETHKNNSPWTKYYQKGVNNIIPSEELGKYFASNSKL